MSLYKSFYYVAFICITSLLFTCGSMQSRVNRENEILKNYNEQKRETFDRYLVDVKQYTTNGDFYHKKYYRHLISIASDVVDKKKLNVVKDSIGFYYDRKSKNREKLYLGLDIDTGKNMDMKYNRAALELLNEHLRDLVGTVNSCKSVFDEANIMGMVIGFKWKRDSADETVTIWIDKNDVMKYEDNQLTFEELLMRNTVTNTQGKIFRLPL